MGDPVEPTSHEEAIAQALADSQPGDIVAIHEESCQLRVTDPDDDACTCTPLVIVVTGATA